MATENERVLAEAVYELQRQMIALGGARQLPSSTFDTGDGVLGIIDAAAAGAGAAAALPAIEEGVEYGAGSVDVLRTEIDDQMDGLDDVLEDAASSLADARADLDDAQALIDDNFEQMGGDVQAAIVAAGTAEQSAEYARDLAEQAGTDASNAKSLAQTAQSAADDANSAALAASGLAAAKGEVIVQVSAPTGSRANPANLWIDVTLDANGKPKNTPNRYNTTTSKWEPITDQKVIDAAAVAAAAQSAAATAKSAADTADAKAVAAQGSADTAQQTANNAGQAAAAAQTAADQARTAAAVAAAKAVSVAAGVLVNGSAEFDFDSWEAAGKGTIAVQSTKRRSGSKAWQVDQNGEIVQGYFPVKAGDTWRFRGWFAVDNAGNVSGQNGGLRLQKYNAAASSPAWSDAGSYNPGSTPRADFTMGEVLYTVPADVTHLRARLAFANPAGIRVYFDDVELVNVTDAKAAADAADTAKAAAQAAQTTADQAKTAASSAQGAADAAQRTADTAKANAATAQTAADNANSQALAAAGIANGKGKVIVQVSAPTGANAAAENLWIDISTNASGVPKNTPNRWNSSTSKWEVITDQKVVDAAAAAATAQSTADTAKANAATAQSTADTAKSNAAAAQTTADQAKSAAATAQTAADNANSQALTATGLANGKGRVIYQASAPTGTNANAQNLWIRTTDNTPWTYNGSTWVQVTDKTATDAAAAAAAANTAAQNAKAAADAAQATANGRPLILFSTSGPSGNAPTGSTWFQVNTAQSVVGQWQQTGSATSPVWTARPITSEVIANLDVGKLTAGTAAIATVVAQKIAASTASFQTVNVANLFVTSGATMQQAVIDYLFANVVMAKKITADMIDVNSLNGVTLTGTVIRSAASGRRLEILQTEVVFYNDNTRAGSIRGDFGPTGYGGLVLRIGDWLSAGPLEAQGSNTDPAFYQTTLLNQGDFNNTGTIRASRGGSKPNGKVSQMISDEFVLEWGSPLDNTGEGRRRRVFATIDMTNGIAKVDADDFTVRGTSITADTGWKDIPGVPSTINSFAYYRVIGNRVYLRGSFQRPNQAQFVNGYTPVGTLPAGARPSQYMRVAISMYNGITANLIIGTDGYMQVGASTGATADTVYVGGVNFLNN